MFTIKEGILLIYLILLYLYISLEIILISKGLGVQLTKIYISGRKSHMFIELSKIKSIIINEAISCTDIVTYLAIILKNKSEMILVFNSIRPKTDILVEIYNDCRKYSLF